MASLEQGEQFSRRGKASFGQSFVHQFELLREHFHHADGGHLRPALEGLQVALQRRQCRDIVRITQPAFQDLVRALQHITGFFEK
ncbi:hypothetical protein D3C81_720430 [compost metagenome]